MLFIQIYLYLKCPFQVITDYRPNNYCDTIPQCNFPFEHNFVVVFAHRYFCWQFIKIITLKLHSNQNKWMRGENEAILLILRSLFCFSDLCHINSDFIIPFALTLDTANRQLTSKITQISTKIKITTQKCQIFRLQKHMWEIS